MKRRILVQIDAGDSTCRCCEYLSSEDQNSDGETRYRCDLFGLTDGRRHRRVNTQRLPECLAAEQGKP